MPASPLRVALAQLPGAGGTLAERAARAERVIADAAGADLVVFPEAYLPGYAHVVGDAAGEARRVASGRGACVAIGFLAGPEPGEAAGDPRGSCELGLASLDGGWSTYRKRFPSPDERRVWRAGACAGIVATPLGRVGLLVCADVLQRRAWRDLRGRVDIVVVSAAWPDYRGREARVAPATRPLVRWLARTSGPYRDDLLGRAAAYVGAPVVFVNATGPWEGEEGFSGGSAAWDAAGVRVVGPLVDEGVGHVELRRGGHPSLPTLSHPPPWEALAAAWRVAGRLPGGRGPG